MTTLENISSTVRVQHDERSVDDAQALRVTFLARDARRHRLHPAHVLRLAAEHGLNVLVANRPHLELSRAAIAQPALAASTIPIRTPTWCATWPCSRGIGPI